MARISGNLASLLKTALAALREGDVDAADALGQRLLEAAPADAATQMLLAAIALRRGDHEAATRWALSCLALSPGHPPALVLAGRAARGRGDVGEAARLFRLAAEHAPQRADAAFMLCAALLDLGDPSANAMLGDLLRRFPDDAEGWREIGRTLGKAGQFDAAFLAFSRAARVAGEPADEIERASMLRAQGRLAEAAEILRAACRRFPAFPEIPLQLGLTLHKWGEFAAARSVLEELVATQATNMRAWFALGLACQDSRAFSAAIAAYRRALELQPNTAEIHVNLGICLQQAGDLASAKQAFGAALALRADTFGRIAQALPSAPRGELWLDPERLRGSLAAGSAAACAESPSVDAGPV